MAEGIFWIFISFFAVIGLLEFFRMIQCFVCRRETQTNLLLIPVGDDTDVGVECRIHTAVSENLTAEEQMLVVDVGMGEKNRDICTRLCELYGIQTATLDELTEKVKKIYKKE